MGNNALSTYNFSRFLLLGMISGSYNEQEEQVFAVLPVDVYPRIVEIIKKYTYVFDELIDQQTFLNNQENWERVFFETLKESAHDLGVNFLASDDGSSINLSCSNTKSKKIREIYNSSNLKNEMNIFIWLLTNPQLLNIESKPKLEM